MEEGSSLVSASSSSDKTDCGPTVGTKIFLGGLSWETTEDKLLEHFSSYGEIIEAVVMRDRQTGRPRGFGFVTFVEEGLAPQISADSHVLDGRHIDAKQSVPQEQKPKVRKVFVGGIAPNTSSDELASYFERFGPVQEVQIMHDHMSGRSRGFGFVTFEEDASAERAYAVGSMHDIGGKHVEVKPATPKGTGPTKGLPQHPRQARLAASPDTVGPRRHHNGASESNRYDVSGYIYANGAQRNSSRGTTSPMMMPPIPSYYHHPLYHHGHPAAPYVAPPYAPPGGYATAPTGYVMMPSYPPPHHIGSHSPSDTYPSMAPHAHSQGTKYLNNNYSSGASRKSVSTSHIVGYETGSSSSLEPLEHQIPKLSLE